jgi:hypothetical protein
MLMLATTNVAPFQRLNVVIATMLLVYGAGRPGKIVVSGGYRGTKKEDALRWKVRPFCKDQ